MAMCYRSLWVDRNTEESVWGTLFTYYLKSTPFHRVSFYVAIFSQVTSPLNEDSRIDVTQYEGLEKSLWLVQILWPSIPLKSAVDAICSAEFTH
jgi:hypothetical protein